MKEDRSFTITVTTTVTQMFSRAMTRLDAVFKPNECLSMTQWEVLC